MPDHFAALELPRRPWLDATELKDRFHALSARLHPDVPSSGDGQRFVVLNAAYAILRDPAARARHLLELEAPELAAASAPVAALGDLFMRQAGLSQRAAAFLKKRESASSPLARALLASETAALVREAGAVMEDVGTASASALDELRALDPRWPDAARADYEALATVQQQLAFLGKWRAQLQEMIFQLSA